MKEKGKIQNGRLNIFLRLLKQGKRYTFWYIVSVIIAIASSSSATLAAEAVNRMITGATKGDLDLIIGGGLMGFTVSAVLIPLFIILNHYGSALLNNYSTVRFQNMLYKKLFDTEFSNLNGYHSGDLVVRIVDNAAEAQNGMNTNLLELINNAFFIVFSLGYLTYISPVLLFGALSIAVIFPLSINPISKIAYKYIKGSKQQIADLNALTQDALSGAEVVRAYDLSHSLTQKYRDLYSKYMVFRKKDLKFTGIMNVIEKGANFAGLFFTLVYGGILTINGRLEIGQLVAFTTLFNKVGYRLSDLSMSWVKFQEAIADAERAFEIMDLSEEEFPGDERIDKIGDIEFRNIGFRYNLEAPVLKDISFKAEKGKVTALVGISGSGKSTLMKLLLKLYTPSSGEILCSGMNIQDISNDSWRSKIAYVSQDPCLFSGTIAQNITFGREASAEEIENAAKDANIYDFIMSTPDGFDTQVGEKALNLSGGQRQRIAIARAILKKSEILVLDEPTSSLDNESEKLISQALTRLMQGKTTIIIAHRLSTIKNADKIVLINNGEIKEQGTHEELIRLGKAYGELYAMTGESEAAV